MEVHPVASKPEVQVEWYKKSSDLPASQKAWDEDALSGNDKLSAFGDQLKNTMLRRRCPPGPGVLRC